MKIGYILLCHKDPSLVAKIANSVTEETDNIVVVHVDAKTNIKPFVDAVSGNSNVVFLENRTTIYWGGFSSIVATMNALEVAVTYQCDRYVLLQGCDYPIHSNRYIADFFEKNKTVEFLKAYNITNSSVKINYMKCYGYHFFDGVDRSKKNIKTFIARAVMAFNKLGIKYRKGFYLDKTTNKKYEIYWGWGHFALTHDCVVYILKEYKNNIGLNKYFRHIFPADETYIQTIVYNSGFKSQVLDKGPVEEIDHLNVESMLNLTYFEYPKMVRVFSSLEEIKTIDTPKYLFIRKVADDTKLLSDIDNMNKNGDLPC